MADENDVNAIDDDSPSAPAELRAAYERQKARGDRAEALERENAALKAGVDVTTRLGQAWLRDYKGPLDDPTAMVADAKEFSPTLVGGAATSTATDAGAASTTQTSQEAGTVTTSDTGSEQRMALADGAAASATATTDVTRDAITRAEAAIREGTSREVAMGGAINLMANGLASGEIRALPSDGRNPRP